MKKKRLTDFFEEVETTTEYSGYFCSVAQAIVIVILGSFCGLRNVSQIHQWSKNTRVADFLCKHFGITNIPCYYWLLCLLKMVNPVSLNQCFVKWVETILPKGKKQFTISLDGKTICSTAKMDRYENPLHIVSAQISQLGITFGQQTVDGKSNEIPAVRALVKLLNIEGCMIVADALHCQKDTAKAIVSEKADYLLSVKDNQKELKENIETYIQDAQMRKSVDIFEKLEKNSGRIERRTAYSTSDVDWLYGKDEWSNLSCIGAIHTEFTTKKGRSSEWHYYISSRSLTAEEMLHHARMEWSVETMHWLLDVHFGEDFCRVEDENVQQNLNILRKAVLNSIKLFKTNSNSKRAVSKIMLDCLLEPEHILNIIQN